MSVKRVHSACLALVFAAVHLVAVSMAGPCGVAGNDTLHIAFIHDDVDPAFNDALLVYHAVTDAVNANGGINGCNVTLREVTDRGYLPTVNPYAATMSVVRDPAVIAIIEPSRFITEAVVGVSRQARVPVIAPFGLQGVLFSPALPHVFHIASEIKTELAQLLNYGLNGEPKCNLYCIVNIPDYGVDTTAANSRKEMLRVGLPEPVMIQVPSGTSLQTRHQEQIAHFKQAINNLPTGRVPDCYIMMLETVVTQHVVITVTSNATLYDKNSTTFFGNSFAQMERWVDTHGNSAPFARLVSTVPRPQEANAKYTFVQKYHKVVADYVAANPSPNFTVPSSTVSSLGIDSYVNIRLLFEAMSRVPPTKLSGPALSEAIYNTRLFTLDDFVLGPFSKQCVGSRPTATGPCFCNSGARRVFTIGVNGTTGRSHPIEDNAEEFESGIAEIDIPMSQCALSSSFLKPSVHVITDVAENKHTEVQSSSATASFPSRRASSTAPVSQEERETHTALQRSLRLGLLRIRKALAQYPTSLTLTAPVTSMVPIVDAPRRDYVHQRYRVAAITASSSLPDDEEMKQNPKWESLTLAPMHYEWPEEDRPVVPFEQWNSWYVPFWPSVATMVHTAILYAANEKRLSQNTVIICDSARLADLATKSTHTAGVSTAHVVVVPASVRGSQPNAEAWLREVLAGKVVIGSSNVGHQTPLSGKENGAVIIGSQSSAVLTAVGVVSKEIDSSVPVVFAASEFVLQRALMAQSDASATSAAVPFGGNAMFVSGLSTYTSDNSAVTSYGEALAQVTAAFTQLGGNHSARIAKLYDAQFLVADRLTLGPFSRKPCSSSSAATSTEICQSAQGITRLYIRRVNASAVNSNTTTTSDPAMAVYQHQNPSGRVVYVPLPADSTSSTNTLPYIVVGIAGALIVIVIAIALVLLYLRSEAARDNSNAPTDETMPFTMVFTDIQASTMLWAQAPQHMGPALDTHHEIIRQLVVRFKGYEVKTIGDSFMVAFAEPRNAMYFALAIQETLFDFDWATALFDATYKEVMYDTLPDVNNEIYAAMWNGIRVRVGVHYGMGEIKFDITSKGYDYYGTVVNTAARVEGVGHGGQILMTKAAMEAVTVKFTEPIDELAVASVTDLGPHPLRGLDEQVYLYQLVPPRFKGRQFPPLRLDVEIDVNENASDEDNGSGHGGGGGDTKDLVLDTKSVKSEGGSQSQSRASSHLDRVASFDAAVKATCRANGGRISKDALAYVFKTVSAILSTSSLKRRRDTVRSWAEQWRVAKNTPPALAKLQRSGAVSADDVQLLRVAANAVAAVSLAGEGSDSQSGLDVASTATSGMPKTPKQPRTFLSGGRTVKETPSSTPVAGATTLSVPLPFSAPSCGTSPSMSPRNADVDQT